MRAEREEAVAIRPERAPASREVLLDHVEGERVVAGRHRRVRREHGRLANLLERIVEGRALFDEIADPLQHDEAGVPFVQVKDRRIGAERLERADAADAEDDFLLDAGLAIAAVEPRREFAIPRRVLGEIGVQEVQLHAAGAHAPHLHQHRAFADRHCRDAADCRQAQWPSRSAVSAQFSRS